MSRHTPIAAEDPWDDRRRGRRDGTFLGPVRITPVRIVLLVAMLGSLGYLAFVMTSVRDASQIPLMVAGAVVLGVVFLMLAVAGGQGTLAAGREGRNRDALALALSGGIAAIIGFSAVAGAIVLAMVWRA